MQEGKKIKTISFIIGLITLLYIMSLLFMPVNTGAGGLYKKAGGISKEPLNTIDYLAIGDSECSTSISPMEIWNSYGYAGYNCGVPGQRLQDTYYLLKRILNKQSPKVVLLETNATFRDFKYINALETKIDEKTKKLFPIYQYHNNWKYFHFYMLKNFSAKAIKKPSSVYKGYQRNTITRPYTGGPYTAETDKVHQIGDQPVFYLKKIMDLCNKKGIRLILYSSPSPKCWSYAKHNAMKQFADKNGLDYVDLNLSLDRLSIDWNQDSRDSGDHINYYGAKKVSAYLGNYLSGQNLLTDHRQDSSYTTWNQELKRYLADNSNNQE
ncbi:hypothetical protein [Lacrimispora sp.]|jgi:hypothetical protein|uniref:hypothetical protein n=1 Tax=Lacrimispora sp. TaxID=2719234 RepID=UPI0029E2DACF|nr:hypothetical protein [Lacrimispora sp.]